jgi:hypothetical protein
MKAGDLIINIPDHLLVTVDKVHTPPPEGTCTFIIQQKTTGGLISRFTGTIEDLFKYLHKQEKARREHIEKFGLRYFI